jgi:acyl carrier protein
MTADNDIPEAIAEEVRRIVADTLRLRIEDVGLDARLDGARLGVDSLGLIKLHVALEEAFDITMPDLVAPEKPGLLSVRDVAAFVARERARAEGGAQ